MAPAAPTLDPGSRVVRSSPVRSPAPTRLGSFELIEEIGRGGAGVVYRARQLAPERDVALKLLSGLSFASERERDRFVTEASIAARLEHPGIIPVFEVGEVERHPFFTMALVEGGNLKQKLAQGPFESADAAQLLLELCDAVHYAHGRGIVHRDLKPENVLFDRSGHARIADFGLAKDFASERELTKTGEILGTPSFMAPEQVSGEAPIGAGTDVYALGCVLYACLTGRPPFAAASVVATLRQVMDAVPVPPRLANPAVPRDLDAICMKCLEKQPEDRYASALELAEDLRAFLEDRPVQVDNGRTNAFLRLLWQETRHTDVMARWSRIGRVHAALVLTLFLATGALAWLGAAERWILIAAWIPGGLAAAIVPVLLRLRRGPLSQIERQLAGIWSMFAATAAITMTSHLSAGAPLLDLQPVILAQCALAIGCMSVILRGSFYTLAIAYGLGALVVAAAADWAIAPVGAALCTVHFSIAQRARAEENSASRL